MAEMDELDPILDGVLSTLRSLVAFKGDYGLDHIKATAREHGLSFDETAAMVMHITAIAVDRLGNSEQVPPVEVVDKWMEQTERSRRWRDQ